MIGVMVGDVRSEQQGALVASGQSTVILGPLELGRRPTKTFTVCNYGPTTLSGVIVQVNPDPGGFETLQAGARSHDGTARRGPDAALWHTYDATSFAHMPSGTVRSLVANDLFRWWRLLGVNVSPQGVMVSGWCYASTF